jgi:uncharacterized protein YndB with AHSA1/START domain
MPKVKLLLEPGQQEFTFVSELAVPRELVYRVYTDPALMPQWWGPAYLTTVVEVMEVRPGGRWRVVQRAPDGSTHPFNGVYHLVKAPEKLIYTFEYEGEPEQVMLNTVTFEEKDGKTLLLEQSVFQSVADRDAMAATDMEAGARESIDRLDQLIQASL